MNISSVEGSFFKYLYESFEVAQGIRVFENVFYVNFDEYDEWIVLDSLSNTTGPVPVAYFFLHISTKNGLLNEKAKLDLLCDKVMALINPGARMDVFSSTTGTRIGEMEVCQTSLAPILQHAGGGSYRSLTVGLVYAGN